MKTPKLRIVAGTPLNSEHVEQCALFRWARLMSGARPELGMLFAVPNGFYSTPRQKKKMVLEGLESGVPDVCLAVPSGQYHALFIEMKVKGKKPSPAQKKWHTKLRGWGYCVRICYDWTEAQEVILSYLRRI